MSAFVATCKRWAKAETCMHCKRLHERHCCRELASGRIPFQSPKPLLSHHTSPPLLLQNLPTGQPHCQTNPSQPTLRLATMTPEHHSCPDRVADLSARLFLLVAFMFVFGKKEDNIVPSSLLLFILSFLLTRLWTFVIRCIKLIWSIAYGLSVRVRTVNTRWSSGKSFKLPLQACNLC